MYIVEFSEKCGLLRGVNETVENEVKEQKADSLVC